MLAPNMLGNPMHAMHAEKDSHYTCSSRIFSSCRISFFNFEFSSNILKKVWFCSKYWSCNVNLFLISPMLSVNWWSNVINLCIMCSHDNCNAASRCSNAFILRVKKLSMAATAWSVSKSGIGLDCVARCLLYSVICLHALCEEYKKALHVHEMGLPFSTTRLYSMLGLVSDCILIIEFIFKCVGINRFFLFRLCKKIFCTCVYTHAF